MKESNVAEPSMQSAASGHPRRRRCKAAARLLPQAVWCGYQTWRYTRQEPRILVVGHSGKVCETLVDFLGWVRAELPELGARLEFRALPCRSVTDWSRYALLVAWADDSFMLQDRGGYLRSLDILAACQESGVSAINPVNEVNRGKVDAARCIARTGIRVPRMIRIPDIRALRRAAEQLGFPLLLREDRGHGRTTHRVETYEDLEQIDLACFDDPIAVEFVETRDPRDGRYRKYRYLAAGDAGHSRHLVVHPRWEVRPEGRLLDEASREEERAFVESPNPHHERLQQARLTLGLDVVGFDYSLDAQGQLVVWEANPFPNLNYPEREGTRHLRDAVERSFALLGRWYLQRAGVPLPDGLRDRLESAPVNLPTTRQAA